MSTRERKAAETIPFICFAFAWCSLEFKILGILGDSGGLKIITKYIAELLNGPEKAQRSIHTVIRLLELLTTNQFHKCSHKGATNTMVRPWA